MRHFYQFNLKENKESQIREIIFLISVLIANVFKELDELAIKLKIFNISIIQINGGRLLTSSLL